MLNARYGELVGLLDEIKDDIEGTPYLPFQNYGGRELRAQQGYLAKFPTRLVAALFDLPTVEARPTGAGAASTPAANASPRKSKGQGYMADAQVRTALEAHAVAMAKEYYLAAGATKIEELGKPYDLRVMIDGVERHVEVKGSSGEDIESVQLTQGEVDHAADWQPTDMLVVDAISAARDEAGNVTTSGGTVRLWSEWEPAPSALRPTHLRYSLPDSIPSGV
ncbi:protein NO VEIN domain-containing protein [Demequina sp. NBRC 110052]|uniref:protein NO VEIN domain-containing protein n=1 Tax=Demequina sp. NBRC 110052 TaxID=1570341 RepID=UPI0013562CF9|nr:DUF3883 domain-containing protein [Demequina sp. NBRC 110052]